MGRLGLGCSHGPALSHWLNTSLEDRELVLQGTRVLAKWVLCRGELAESPCWVHDVLVSATSDRAQETEKPSGAAWGRWQETQQNRQHTMTWDQRAWNKLVSRTTASSNISGAGQPKLYVPVSVLPLTSYATLMTLHHFGGGLHSSSANEG